MISGLKEICPSLENGTRGRHFLRLGGGESGGGETNEPRCPARVTFTGDATSRVSVLQSENPVQIFSRPSQPILEGVFLLLLLFLIVSALARIPVFLSFFLLFFLAE